MNWTSIIQDLLSSGLTQAQLGAAIGKSQAWVHAAATGKYDDLRYTDGQALLKLHSQRCQEAAA